jgi:hypothetical protein
MVQGKLASYAQYAVGTSRKIAMVSEVVRRLVSQPVMCGSAF